MLDISRRVKSFDIKTVERVSTFTFCALHLWAVPCLSTPFLPLPVCFFFRPSFDVDHLLLLCLHLQIYLLAPFSSLRPLSRLPFPTISQAPFFFIPLNSPAVGVASGLVFCGGISGVYASFMLWMVVEAGFTAPAVMPQRLSLSRLAVKWSAGPLGEATPRTLLLKALS